MPIVRRFKEVGWLFNEGWLRDAFASTIFNAATILRIEYWGLVWGYCAVALDTLLGVVRHVGWAGAWIKEWKRCLCTVIITL